ncbi:dermonecrotic toxin domain-containing protein [Pseudomonas sp. NPDC007930]|uniref:dermonecrotic toxin domain-containing protein n=1 Tax=Pseudomonas sp. NPDC007930 TaxID=3364417 RepID=UPI0036E3882C
MPSTPDLPFFDPTALQAAFDESITARFSAEEQALLRQATQADYSTFGYRLDTLAYGPGHLTAPSLAGALLISHPEQPQLYLATPVRGVERFESRAAAVDELRARAGVQVIEATLIDRSPFEAQGRAYQRARVARLNYTAGLLAGLPSLAGPAAANTLEARLQALIHWWTTLEGVFSRLQWVSQAYTDGLYQALLEARHRPGLEPPTAHAGLVAMLTGGAVRACTLAYAAQGDNYGVAGGLMWEGDWPGCWLYLPGGGVQWFTSAGDARAELVENNQVAAGLTQAGLRLWLADPARQLSWLPVAEDGQAVAVGHILQVQAGNARAALTPLPEPVQAQDIARFDTALDIRAQVDPLLAAVDPSNRWTGMFTHEQPAPFSASQVPATPFEMVERLILLRAWRLGLAVAQPGAALLGERLLRPWLGLYGTAVHAQAITVAQPDAQAGPPRPLTELLLERASGVTPGPFPAQARLAEEAAALAPGLSLAVLDGVLDDVAGQFFERYQATLKHIFEHGQPVNLRWLATPAMMNDTLENLLRIELALARRHSVVPEPTLALLGTALQAEASVHAYGLDIQGDPNHPTLRLRSLVVLCPAPAEAPSTEPLGPVLFWSAAGGLRQFEHLAALCQSLEHALNSRDFSAPWFADLSAINQQQLKHFAANPEGQGYSVLPWRLEGGLLQPLNHSLYAFRQHEWGAVLARAGHERYAGALLAALLDLVATLDPLGEGISRLSEAWRSEQAAELLPQWWLAAEVPDRQAFLDFLTDCGQAAGPTQDYLEGLPTLEAFARQQVHSALLLSGIDLDPDAIIVLSRSYVPAPVALGSLPSAIPAAVTAQQASLSVWALQHSSRFGETLSLQHRDGAPLPEALTPVFVRNLARELDCGARYQHLLEQELGGAGALRHTRRARFYQQMARQMLVAAWAQKMGGSLDPQAFDWVERVARLPDSVAREDAGLGDVVFARLALTPRAGDTPDDAPGIYLIGHPRQPGPVLLFCLYTTELAFRRFADFAALATAIHHEPGLQALVLQRLAPERRAIYENDGFEHPHVHWRIQEELFPALEAATTTPVRIGFLPVTGNTLGQLYDDNLRLLKAMAAAQSSTTEEARWRDLRYLLTLGLEQGSMFLPMPFALVIGAWQSERLAADALAALRDQHWGQALSELTAAMAGLMPVRTAHESTPALKPNPASIWEYGALPPAMARRLSAFEVADVVLAGLSKEQALGLYREHDRYYASVEGKVFIVKAVQGRWRIVDAGGRSGPWLRQGEHGRWHLDLGGLRGGMEAAEAGEPGAVRPAELGVFEAQFDVRYQGFAQINAANPSQGQAIREGLALARQYMEGALQSLPAAGPLPAHAEAALVGTFGPDAQGPELVAALRGRIDALYQDASSASLGAEDSERWVAGVNKAQAEPVTSFVVPGDPLRRLYLTEEFFADSPFISEVNAAARHSGFSVGRHHRAAVLTHELAHLNGDAVDVVYLESNSPFEDFLFSPRPAGLDRRLQALRGALSYNTPREHLFKHYDYGHWYEWSVDNVPDETPARVLALTGAQSVAEARDLFYADPAKRREVILSNADSLAWLILCLGRQAAPGG